MYGAVASCQTAGSAFVQMQTFGVVAFPSSECFAVRLQRDRDTYLALLCLAQCDMLNVFFALNVADSYAKVASCLEKSATQETERDMQRLLARGSDLFEKLKKLEARVGTDEELKLSDTLRYYMKDTQAAKVTTLIYFHPV
uniref:BRO1 domain-containing protein n=1 Tax=Ascaris lumbricoides TaxID=6252 RepID=A0A0M3I4E8_ASCLU